MKRIARRSIRDGGPRDDKSPPLPKQEAAGFFSVRSDGSAVKGGVHIVNVLFIQPILGQPQPFAKAYRRKQAGQTRHSISRASSVTRMTLMSWSTVRRLS